MPKSIKDKLSDGEYLDAWRQFKDENPKTYTAVSVTPVLGQIAAIPDYAEAMQRGSTADSIKAATAMLPGVSAERKLLSAAKVVPSLVLGDKGSKLNQIKEAVSNKWDSLTNKPTLSTQNDFERAWNES